MVSWGKDNKLVKSLTRNNKEIKSIVRNKDNTEIYVGDSRIETNSE